MRPAGPCPPPPPLMRSGPRPPAPPGGAPRPPFMAPKPRRPVHPNIEEVEACSKTKLKPFFWDKVMANPDDSMVWSQIKAGSFQFNEEMIESLFGYTPTGKNKLGTKKESSSQNAPQIIHIIDSKKAQNLSILLKALNVTTQEVTDALEEGNELPPELIQTLLKMAPTAEEELKLRLYTGDLLLLGPAERFLKVVVDIPYSFKRLETLHFMCILEEETTTIKEAFVILEAACAELKKSRLFLKLLEAVLKTGNRMNSGTFRGGAQAFKLDTLLKLADVKGIDGKTTLLHFVVLEIIRSEGLRAARAARELRSMSSFRSEDLTEDPLDPTLDSDEYLRNLGLQVVSSVGSDLKNVKRAAALDVDNITGTVAKLGHALIKAQTFLNTELKDFEGDKGFVQVLRSFLESAEGDVRWMLEEEKRITSQIKSTADYFHGNAVRDEGFRLFLIVRDFLIILDKVCKEVRTTPPVPSKPPPPPDPPKKVDSAPPDPRKTTPLPNPPNKGDLTPDTRKTTPLPDPGQKLQLALANTQPDSSDSSDSSSSSGSSSSEDDPPKKEDSPPDTQKTTSMLDPGQKLQLALANSPPDSSDSSDSSSSDDDPTVPGKPAPPLNPPKKEDPTPDTQKTTSVLDPVRKLQLALANGQPDSSDSSDSLSSDDDPLVPSKPATSLKLPKKEDLTPDTRKTTLLLDPGEKLQLALANSQPDSSSSSDSSSSDDDPEVPRKPSPPLSPPEKEDSTLDTQKNSPLLMLQLALTNSQPDNPNRSSSDDDLPMHNNPPQLQDPPKKEDSTLNTPKTSTLLDPGRELQLALGTSQPDSSDNSSSEDDLPLHSKPPPRQDPPKKEDSTSDTPKITPLLDPGQKLQLALSNSPPDSSDSSCSGDVTSLLDPGQELLLALANSHPDKADNSDNSNSDDDPPMPSTALLPPDPPENDNPSDTPKTTTLLDTGQKLQLAQANSQLDRSDSSDCSSSGDDPPMLSKEPPPPNNSPKKEGSISDTQKTTPLLDPGQKLQLALANTLPDSSDHWSLDDD